MEYNLSLALCDSMSNEAETIATSLLEVGLDAVMDDGILKEILSRLYESGFQSQ